MRLALLALASGCLALLAWSLLRAPLDHADAGEGRSASPAADSPRPGAPDALRPVEDEQTERHEAEVTTGSGSSIPSPAESRAPAPEAVDSRVTVLVVDAGGAPCGGVPVELTMTVPGFGDGVTIGRSESGEDGRARIELVELDERRKQLDAMELTPRFRLEADIPSSTPVTQALPGWPEPGDEHVLRLPPLGSVVVEVVDSSGELYVGEGTAGLWWISAAELRADPDASYERYGRFMPDLEGGRARFDSVGTGLLLRVIAAADGHELSVDSELAGPTAAGETRVLQVSLGPPSPRLRLRVLQPDGTPLASRSLESYTWIERGLAPGPYGNRPNPSHSRLETDGSGHIEIDGYGAGQVDFDRRLQVWIGDRYDPLERHHASVYLPRELRSGEVHELGEITLQPPHLLLEGRVLDAEGAPVREGTLRFTEGYETAKGLAWQNLGDGRVRLDPDGSFSLVSIRRPFALGVHLHVADRGSLDVEELPIGQRGVELRLVRPAPEADEPEGTLAIAALLDAELPGSFFELLLVDETTRARGLREPAWLLGLEGEVRELPGVKPGHWTAIVRTRGLEAEVLRIEDIVVAANETCREPRLTPFDLRGLGQRLRLTLTWADGTPVQERQLRVRVPGTKLNDWRKTDSAGVLELALPRSAAELTLNLHRGPALQVSLAAGGEQTLTLPTR